MIKDSERDWDATQHYKNESVAQEYDRIRFSSLAGRVFNRGEQTIIQQCFADLPRDTVILDLPCGTGRLAGPLLGAGLRVHGADISQEMLDVAQARLAAHGERFSTEVIDAFALADAPPRFEAALCARVLMHFPLETQISFLRGVAALVHRRVVINHSLNSPYQRFRRGVKALLGHQKSARFPITDAEIRRLLDAAGLREVRRYRINRFVSEAVYIVAEKAA